MSEQYLLSRDHLPPLLRRLGKEYRLVAPVTNDYGDTLFQEIADPVATAPDLQRQPQNSLKDFLFPQRELLYDYRVDEQGGYHFREPATDIPATLFFGVRPCDLNAVLYLDVIFLPGRREPGYRRRRENSLLIGLNCNQPFADCFCAAVKAGPFLEDGSDLQLTDLGREFLVEVGRARGAEIIKRWPHFFRPAPAEERNRRFQLYLEARGSFLRQVHADQAIKRLAANATPPGVWEEVASRCQDCNGCAYLCPTCSCFTIVDEAQNQRQGRRWRLWDACTATGFTAMAGGHNPVQPAKDKLRQRFRHKLELDVKKHGRPSCMGCGRCVGVCFGGTDILHFINLAGR
ncbi:4Fe-4S dicluster domain-containing protein [Desulfurivibrio alkaliphilus]|uniref:4Fe-4S ferredoxin iron-sulfur binding domain-containing protein n=1 Tax=Desulfurivibrio alkaliphilus (strain DSM 19089 / UNIQEM U267 / AHT2) TaxID=589865 RepID=D6Z5F4_DESAT|nr:4Fe-4S dicluster domain-containing protein [Desulfurivibrio alkaliphilus]ADH86691.1 4Fe-4S ferredoxin iron-sulfur binding domain-containing protein [Desulfurivibrio alkaliphilus AHT 2]